MIFLDASAVIAVLMEETGFSELLAMIKADKSRFCSALSRWETIAGLCKSYRYLPSQAKPVVDDFLRTFDVQMISIDRREASFADEAYERYGRGRHPAALNMGDCFAYACAKSLGASLIYVGADFSKTDLG